jgi:hypothetical protein
MFGFLQKAIVRKVAASYVRKGLTLLSGYLITSGVLDQTDMPALLEVGAELTPLLISAIWSFIDKRASEREVEIALSLPSGSSRANVDDVKALAKN